MPLSENDLTLLQGMLLYPEKFLRLVNEYYNKRRVCVSPAMGERLAAAALEEKNGRILKDIVNVDVGKYLKNISIIYSAASGLGKSFQIKSEIQKANKQYEHFPVGGVFCRENIIKRLHKINFKPGKTVIHLDLYETKDNNLMKDFLFSFLILRSYFDNNLIFYLDSSIEIKIELPCGFIDYFKKFPLLTLP